MLPPKTSWTDNPAVLRIGVKPGLLFWKLQCQWEQDLDPCVEKQKLNVTSVQYHQYYHCFILFCKLSHTQPKKNSADVLVNYPGGWEGWNPWGPGWSECCCQFVRGVDNLKRQKCRSAVRSHTSLSRKRAHVGCYVHIQSAFSIFQTHKQHCSETTRLDSVWSQKAPCVEPVRSAAGAGCEGERTLLAYFTFVFMV